MTPQCAVCHTVAPSMTKEQMRQGIASVCAASEQNEELAAETVLSRKPVPYLSPMMAPYKVVIDALAKKYEPSVFTLS